MAVKQVYLHVQCICSARSKWLHIGQELFSLLVYEMVELKPIVTHNQIGQTSLLLYCKQRLIPSVTFDGLESNEGGGGGVSGRAELEILVIISFSMCLKER